MSEVDDLLSWFLETGVKAGAIKSHIAMLQPTPKAAEADVDAAKALLAHWSRADIETEAHLLFAWKLNKRHPLGPMKGTPSVALLAHWWGSLEPDAPARFVDGENLDDYTSPSRTLLGDLPATLSA